ncbi:MAG: acetate kinase [Solirubrobacterales bacterium]|nr:acetate kinase [Solirubrobacterales bacterium]
MSRVLVLNCGSSSLKYQLVDVAASERLASGVAEGVGGSSSRLAHRGPGGEQVTELRLSDHEHALRAILDAFDEVGPELARAGIVAVGHRVVHGGEKFSAPVLVDDEVLKAIRDLSVLAPLHNPANVEGIEVARRVFEDLPQVAVFDTAFHQTLPPHAYTYAVPKEWRSDHGVRRYGFHGTSHAFVSGAAADLLGRDPRATNSIVLHLGNGASATAVAGGRSVDTSMGLTPLEGLVMGTRSGDLDPAVVFHLRRSAGMEPDQVEAALNADSGLVGLAGDNDLRAIHRRIADGDLEAAGALELYCYRIRKYVGAYYAALGRVDAIVFTAGVGENDAVVRANSLAGLERLGITVDERRNASRSQEARFISPSGAEVAVLVVPTNEELEIATQTVDLLESHAPTAPATHPGA